MMQTIPAVKTPTLMDLLQQFIHLWAEPSFLKNILMMGRIITDHRYSVLHNINNIKSPPTPFFFFLIGWRIKVLFIQKQFSFW